MSRMNESKVAPVAKGAKKHVEASEAQYSEHVAELLSIEEEKVATRVRAIEAWKAARAHEREADVARVMELHAKRASEGTEIEAAEAAAKRARHAKFRSLHENLVQPPPRLTSVEVGQKVVVGKATHGKRGKVGTVEDVHPNGAIEVSFPGEKRNETFRVRALIDEKAAKAALKAKPAAPAVIAKPVVARVRFDKKPTNTERTP